MEKLNTITSIASTSNKLAIACVAGLMIAATANAGSLADLDGDQQHAPTAAGITAAVGERASVDAIGSHLWINVMCKFSDFDDEIPSVTAMDAMFSSEYPGIGHYLEEQSYGALQLNAVTLGWYSLPGTRAEYTTSSGHLRSSTFRDDCLAAAAGDLPSPEQIRGFNFVFNKSTQTYGFGTQARIDLGDGERIYGATHLSPNAALNHSVIVHEMGHAYWLRHSDQPGGNDAYDNTWDVMSGANYHTVYEPGFGKLAKGLNAYARQSLGWLADEDVLTIDESVTGMTIPIERLTSPVAPGYLVATVALDETRYLTIEVRKRTSYDAELPGDAVIIHEVEPRMDWDPHALLVSDLDDPAIGDESEMWRVGETYVNREIGMAIEIVSEDATGFSIVARSQRCGDGIREIGLEQCDDGNTQNNDGCSAICKYEGANRETACIIGMHKAATNVSKTQMKDALWCLTQYSNDRVDGMGSCITSDIRGKVLKATTKTVQTDTTECTVTPSIAYTGADRTNSAAVAGAISTMSGLFNTPLDASIVRQRDSKATAQCQKVAARSLATRMKTEMKIYESCVQKRARKNLITSTAALMQCVSETVNVEGSGSKINKLTLRVRRTLSRSCAGSGMDPFSDACNPGETVAQCTERVASCAVCTTTNGVSGLTTNCDQFDDGDANGTCE